MVGVRYWSDSNQWLDFVIIVNRADAARVAKIVNESMNEYWDGFWDVYGDAVERGLRDAGIKYAAIYHDSENESDEYEKAWEGMLSSIDVVISGSSLTGGL